MFAEGGGLAGLGERCERCGHGSRRLVDQGLLVAIEHLISHRSDEGNWYGADSGRAVGQ